MERTPSDSPSIPEVAAAALDQGKQIEAIKLVREINGIGLKEAKDLVDAYIAGRPDLKEKRASAQSASARGCVLAAVVFLALVAAALLFHFKRSHP